MATQATPEVLAEIRSAFVKFQDIVHTTAKEKGWWEERDKLNQLLRDQGDNYDLDPRVIDTLYRTAKSMLAVSEIAEGVEALRNGDANDDKLTHLNGQSVEIADDIIRQFDLAGAFNLQVIDALIEKLQYNMTRSHKHGGKSI